MIQNLRPDASRADIKIHNFRDDVPIDADQGAGPKRARFPPIAPSLSSFDCGRHEPLPLVAQAAVRGSPVRRKRKRMPRREGLPAVTAYTLSSAARIEIEALWVVHLTLGLTALYAAVITGTYFAQTWLLFPTALAGAAKVSCVDATF